MGGYYVAIIVFDVETPNRYGKNERDKNRMDKPF